MTVNECCIKYIVRISFKKQIPQSRCIVRAANSIRKLKVNSFSDFGDYE